MKNLPSSSVAAPRSEPSTKTFAPTRGVPSSPVTTPAIFAFAVCANIVEKSTTIVNSDFMYLTIYNSLFNPNI